MKTVHLLVLALVAATGTIILQQLTIMAQRDSLDLRGQTIEVVRERAQWCEQLRREEQRP